MARKIKPETTILMEGATHTGPSNTVLIANQHTGAILIPRKGQVGIALNPLVLAAGQVTEVSVEEWDIRKVHPVVQHYLDKGLLIEVSKIGPVPVLDSTSTDLELIIPENLRSDSQQGEYGAAQVTIKGGGGVNV